MELKVLIADDNLGARTLISYCLAKIEGIEVKGEATSGEEALALAVAFHPEVVFLDVRMPGLDGIEVARQICLREREAFVVFVTAYPEYALDAFELYAYDYILKPIDEERVFKTITRIKAEIQARKVRRVALPLSLNRLVIKSGYEHIFLDPEEIIFLEKESKRTLLYTLNGNYWTYETLNELEKCLDHKTFFRSHKSYLINLRMVAKIVPWANGSCLVKFRHTDKEALLSRAQAKILFRYLA